MEPKNERENPINIMDTTTEKKKVIKKTRGRNCNLRMGKKSKIPEFKNMNELKNKSKQLF